MSYVKGCLLVFGLLVLENEQSNIATDIFKLFFFFFFLHFSNCQFQLYHSQAINQYGIVIQSQILDIWIEGQRTEDVDHCTDCKAHSFNAILGYISHP